VRRTGPRRASIGERVRDASGQPFDFDFFARERFVYDTEAAARAAVVMRRRGLDWRRGSPR